MKRIVFLTVLLLAFAGCGNKDAVKTDAGVLEKTETSAKTKLNVAPASAAKSAAKSAVTSPGPMQKSMFAEKLSASHILIMHQESKRKPPSITRTKEEAKKLIDDIYKKLADGGDFAALAKEFSDCPSGKHKGGDLGAFGKGRMAPPFEKAAFALKENEISKVVETDFGYHLIQRLPFESKK